MIEYLSTGQVAVAIGKSRETVNNLIKQGVIKPDAYVKKQALFLASTLDSFLREISRPKVGDRNG